MQSTRISIIFSLPTTTHWYILVTQGIIIISIFGKCNTPKCSLGVPILLMLCIHVLYNFTPVHLVCSNYNYWRFNKSLSVYLHACITNWHSFHKHYNFMIVMEQTGMAAYAWLCNMKE